MMDARVQGPGGVSHPAAQIPRVSRHEDGPKDARILPRFPEYLALIMAHLIFVLGNSFEVSHLLLQTESLGPKVVFPSNHAELLSVEITSSNHKPIVVLAS